MYNLSLIFQIHVHDIFLYCSIYSNRFRYDQNIRIHSLEIFGILPHNFKKNRIYLPFPINDVL